MRLLLARWPALRQPLVPRAPAPALSVHRACRVASRDMSSSVPPQSPADTPQATDEQHGNTASQQPLPLPPPGPDSTTKIDMSSGGTTVKLDHLGPLVVNKDGTLSRIANWEHMADIERQNTLRILGKRNQLRMEGLRASEEPKEDK